MQIEGRSFLVAGGGSGLGRATAEALLAAGGRVLVADLKQAEALPGAGFVAADVTDAAAVQAAVDAAVGRHGALHGAINCAGVAPIGKVLERDGSPHDLDRFRRTIEINLIGTFNVVRLAAAAILRHEPDAEGERGVIVNTASIAAFEGQVGQAAYSASKGGVVGMTLPLARELARHGIRVMAIAPGIFATPMMAGMPDEVQQSLGRQVPFPPRLGRPPEYAALVCHIIDNP
ncbi:MAG: SDR family NAD(P)-dependent oxidoreductase, partial [Candidatus Competibacterales bacterium]|nr:SDR family NAD(P)-dependent oxidoreductase [Candidatus Competibacterales bacterium]